MLFIHPMWDNESQRIGKQLCTPTGYTVHVLSELIGFSGLLLLLATLAVFAWKGAAGTFHLPNLWLLTLPFILGAISEALFRFSWYLALRKQFHYDYERREASWIEAGERRTYRFQT